MTTLSRVTGKVFGGSAPLDEIGQFGSAKAGTQLNTQDVATIQALPAYSNGWGSAIMTSRNFPPIEEVTGALKTISYQACYLLQEGVPEYDVNTNYSATSIVKSISGTTLKFYISLQDDNQGNSLSNATYWAEANLNSGRNIGEIITSTIPLSDAGLHLLDGALISGTGAYADFVSYIASIYNSSLNYFCTEAQWQTSVSQYGACGKFVYNSTNNTVRLPKVTGFIEGTSGTSTLGNLTEAGLPNITGNIGPYQVRAGIDFRKSGAFNSPDTETIHKTNDTSNTGAGNRFIDFDASRSNAIYGNSATVQPQSIKVLYYIVVATTTKTSIEVDIDEIATDLNGKADVDLTNVNDTGDIKMAGAGMPSDTYVNLTLGSSGSTYTAPANGWFNLSKNSGKTNAFVTLKNTMSNAVVTSNSSNSAHYCVCLIPALKNDIIEITYDATGVVGEFRFIYAKGSESEAS